MINGFQCGQPVDLTKKHVELAKIALMHASFVGLQEYFPASVCLFQWTMGGANVEERHFRHSRVGNYTRLTIEDALSLEERARFEFSERFDIELYAYVKDLVLSRFRVANINPMLMLQQQR